MQALDRKLLRDLWHLWGQSIAIALVLACGIAIFVAMQTNYESLQLSQTIYYDQYRFAQVFGQLKRAPESLVTQIRDIPGVAQVQTRVVVDVILDVPNRPEPVTGRLISIPDQPTPMLNDLYLRQGRYIEPRAGDEVLVSEAFAKANGLQLGDRLGAVINGRWQSLQIVGIALSPEYVYEIRSSDIFPDNQRFGVLWMGREALGTAFNMDGAFNDVSLTLLPQADAAEVIFRLDQLLAPYGAFGAYDREDQISNRFLSDEIIQLRTHGTVIPTIFLGIGAFLLHTVLSRLIGTQRDQIAVLKAFGYSNWAIGSHYLKFVMVIVAVGSGLGTGIGLWLGSALTTLYAQFYRFPLLRYEVSPAMVVGALLISSGAAILGAFAAVGRAVSLPPAEAMRPEPPPQFRQTWLEQWGVQRWLSSVERIILRNLERKPIQALLSMLGIALAVALLVLGGFSRDAMNYLVDAQFRTVQREDVMLLFNEPRPARTRYEMTHLPGVLSVEPFRIVPARLRFEHRSHRIGIMGIEPEAELRQLVDRHLQPVSLPLDGLLLSSKLAEILGVQPGDWLTVEVLEGSRPVRTVPIAGLVDELIGLSAYMDIHALNRFMREGTTLSGAFLAVDDHQLDPLYSQLKRTPTVASVSLRNAMIQQFQQTIARSQGVITTVQVVFACIIAFGVVYNAARIALSERGRELATLRIIGFSKVQVAVILLGEQAVLLIAAIPLGLVLGYGLAAFMAALYDTELYRFPLVISRASYAFAVVVIVIAGLISGGLVRRQCDRLDLIAVLKSRE
ncbi:MAG: ABC transporter permease [Synechococcales cyanobacterium C42_A2020_086]|jgi:putative ABC transport system permease protein|nr:ABC transporter permease [Synechococcales cyanobacterium C42_A2020_086]